MLTDGTRLEGANVTQSPCLERPLDLQRELLGRRCPYKGKFGLTYVMGIVVVLSNLTHG